MPVPVLFSAFSSSSTEATSFFERRAANAPATCGVAIEVPLKRANSPSGTEERMPLPGARRSRIEALFVNVETSSTLVVEPTLTAEETQAGAEIAFTKPSFPEAATVAMPSAFRSSIAGRTGSLSQLEKNRPPPRLMLTAAIAKLSLC
jgi:hypothetical protein